MNWVSRVLRLFLPFLVATYGREGSVFRFANSYGDHMVLQMKPHQAVVWGFGELGQEVTFTFNGKDYHSQVIPGTLTTK